jgi:hypothetical protein
MLRKFQPIREQHRVQGNTILVSDLTGVFGAFLAKNGGFYRHLYLGPS